MTDEEREKYIRGICERLKNSLEHALVETFPGDSRGEGIFAIDVDQIEIITSAVMMMAVNVIAGMNAQIYVRRLKDEEDFIMPEDFIQISAFSTTSHFDKHIRLALQAHISDALEEK